MIKKNIVRLLSSIAVITVFIALATACSNEYKDMKPGEVRLKENDYRNDDRLQAITITTAPAEEGATSEKHEISALEMRALWHSVVISAEKSLEYKNENEKNVYLGPLEVENKFYDCLAQSMALLQEQYPEEYTAIAEEFKRADVYAFVHYMWCAQAEEYVELKFRATPLEELPTPPSTDEETTPSSPDTK